MNMGTGHCKSAFLLGFQKELVVSNRVLAKNSGLFPFDRRDRN